MSDLPADFQALSETEIYQGSNVDKYYDSACSFIDNAQIDVYFVIKNGEFEYCYMPYIQIKSDCSSYNPDATINTVTVDGDNYWIGYEYAYFDDSSIYIDGINSVNIQNLYFLMNTYAGNYMEILNTENAYLNYVVFENIDLNYAVCQFRYVTQVDIDNMQLLDSYNNDYYGIMAIYNSDLVTISNLQADNNYSEYGGSIYFENVEDIYISQSQFSDNQAYYEGGAFQVYADYAIGTIQVTDSSFDNNQAYKGGAIYVKYGTNFIIKDCTFSENYGENDGGGIYSYYNDYLTVENIICLKNDADDDGGCLYSENDVYVDVQGSYCEENSSGYGSCHYFQEFSDVYMFDITATLEKVNRGVLYLYEAEGPMEIYQVQIDQTDGNSGSAIGVKDSPYNVRIEDSIFEYNQAQSDDGGAVKCGEINNLTVRNCIFTSNTSVSNGGALAVDSANYVYLYDTIFDSCYGGFGGAAVIEDLVFLYMENVKFKDNTATSSGGGLYLGEVDYFEIYGDTQFTGNVCQYNGGGIQLVEITNDFIIDSLLFDSNESSSGGAMYINDYYTVTIKDSTFSNNVGEYGGVFYLTDQRDNQYLIIKNNVFDQNEALYSGGIIYYDNTVSDYQTIQASYNSYSQNSGAYGLFYINNLYYVDFEFDEFYSNTLSSHAIIRVEGCSYIYVNDNHFEDNTGQFGSCLYAASNYELRANRNVFIDNYANYGGGIYDSSSYSYIQDNTFQTSSAIQGFAIYLYNPYYTYIYNNDFISNSGQSACIYAEGYNVNDNFIVENCLFQNNVANTLSTAIYLDSIYNVQINDLELDSNENNGITVSSLKGGSIYLQLDYLSGLIADPVFIIENIYIHDNLGDSSGGIYIQGAKNCYGCLVQKVTYENCISDVQNELQNIFMIQQSNYIQLDDIKFLQVTENRKDQIIKIQVLKLNQRFNILKLILIQLDALNIQNSGDIVVSNIYVEEYQSAFNSIIRIQASQLISILDSQFYNITSKYEPVIYLQNSDDLIFDDLKFINCINEQGEAGGIYGTQLENFQISQVQMEQIQSSQGSCIYLEQSEYVELTDSVFTENTASISSPGLFFSEGSHYNLQNCLINNNIANSEIGAITINKITNITFADSKITGNDGGQEVGGLTVDNSDDVKFLNLTIENNFSAKQAGGLRFQYTANVQIKDSNINSNKISSNKGGGILIVYGENIYLEDSEINYNEGDYGAGIYIQQSKNIKVKGSDLLNNTAKYSGGAIYVADTEDSYYDNLNIKYNQATSEDGGGIYIDQISEFVEIQNSQIEENYANNNGGGIFVGYLTDLIIKKVEINSNEAEENGSGLYLKQLGKAKISETSFENNFGSVSGGALYSINTQEIEMINSNFKNNQASVQGGAIYVSEQQTLTIEKTEMRGNKIVINKNSKTLIEDQNQSFGGSVYADQVVNFSFKNSLIQDSYSYFKGGGIFATNVNNLILQDSEISQATVEAHIKQDIKEKTQDYLLSKGGGFYYEFNLEDDEVDSTDVKIKLKNMVFEKCIASSGGGMLIKQNPDQDFDYSISNLKFEGNEADIGAGARFLGNFRTNFQDKVEGTSQVLNNKGYLDDNALFYGFFRNERVQSEEDSEFVLCYQGQFLLEGGVISCEPCLENGICEGGYQHIYPQKNYWRSDDESLDYYYCSSYPDACLGHGCEETYDGVLCEDCDLSQNTFKEGVYCVQCDNKSAVVFNQILKMIILIALTLSSVLSLKKKLDEHLLKKILKIFQIVITRENQFSIIMKIFITHNQILSAGSELAEKIPEKLLNYMNFVGNPVDSVSKSLECLFNYKDETDQYEILLKGQLLGYALSILSLLILLAVPIGGTLYSAFQSKVLCDSEFFMLKLMPLHIIMIFILTVIIPLLILRKIHKYYCLGTLYHKMRILRSYGLFYIELSENKYYWEFVWMYMKVIVVVIANFYPSQGTDQIIKTSLITCVVVAYAYLIKLKQPYKARNVNNLAIISSFVQALTLILGVCIIQDDVSSWFVVIAFIVILIGNFTYKMCQGENQKKI
ncbi:Pectin lyase fold/virulence factor [Pseudocohnilembus persalinus]|uniref:Pectin lyase fold/virulence factor n=1 Tax=Pseudocohnilembus persalinus TaxID=266149 RepID=A0A0V0QVS5_PSEPJ|nr:Pectin lyase fold/virulence factor [Pseudocohnilembus persalinus]|eukprot:KRX06154.1 Pectin lyase fold/virulence factor [Pseudocohnilembus persalinus]